MVRESRLVEKLAKVAFIEEKAESLSSENLIFRLSDEKGKKSILKTLNESEGHWDGLMETVEGLDQMVEQNKEKYSVFSKIVDLDEKDEEVILNNQHNLEKTMVTYYEELLKRLDEYEDDEKIEVGNVSFKVGELKEVLKNNLEEEESHIGAVRECLERYYDEHLEESASRGGFRKGSSSG